MNLGISKRQANYLSLLDHIYNTGLLRSEDCITYQVMKGISIIAEEIGLIKRLGGGIVRWMPNEKPTKEHANSLMKASSEKMKIANKKRIELRKNGIQLKIVNPDLYTFDQWIEILRKDPDFEYTLTRVRRNIKPEKLL
jgi:hypothetical protein